MNFVKDALWVIGWPLRLGMFCIVWVMVAMLDNDQNTYPISDTFSPSLRRKKQNVTSR